MLKLVFRLVLIVASSFTFCHCTCPTPDPPLRSQTTNQCGSMNISMEYWLSSQLSSVVIMGNSVVKSNFQKKGMVMSCSDNVFTLTQSSQQFAENSQYFLVLSGYDQNLQVILTGREEDMVPTPNYTLCTTSSSSSQSVCNISLQNNCGPSDTQAYNTVTVTITNTNNIQCVSFQYNFICQVNGFQKAISCHRPIQWGILVIIIFSVFMIFITSKFQQAQTYSNTALYVNVPLIIAYMLGTAVEYLLVILNAPNIEYALYIICLVNAFIIGGLSVMVCFSQAMFMANIKWMKKGYEKGRFKFRVMDVIGFASGTGIVLAWMFTGTNWIVNDIIFVFIYVGTIKMIKFGSLRIAFITFVCSLIVSVIFITILQVAQLKNVNQISNQTVAVFNNPLFLIAPLLANIPKQSCIWYFLLSMAYPGMFLAYLQRFDKNRSSTLYAPIFIIVYAVCSILWFVVTINVCFQLPYDLITVPISIVLILLLANRRGELSDIWGGKFYDEQKHYFKTEQEMMDHLHIEKSPSESYTKQLFSNLRCSSVESGSSRESKFSEIMANSKRIQQGELKPIYSYHASKQKQKGDRQDAGKNGQKIQEVRSDLAECVSENVRNSDVIIINESFLDSDQKSEKK